MLNYLSDPLDGFSIPAFFFFLITFTQQRWTLTLTELIYGTILCKWVKYVHLTFFIRVFYVRLTSTFYSSSRDDTKNIFRQIRLAHSIPLRFYRSFQQRLTYVALLYNTSNTTAAHLRPTICLLFVIFFCSLRKRVQLMQICHFRRAMFCCHRRNRRLCFSLSAWLQRTARRPVSRLCCTVVARRM